MAFSENTFTYLGGAQVFDTNLALGVLEVSHITVTVDGVVDGFGDPIEYNFTYNDTTGEVTVLDALVINQIVRVKRDTPIDMLVVDFDQNADVTKRNLSRSLKQALMSVQENADSREADSIILADTVADINALVTSIDSQVAATAANAAAAAASKTAAELAETNAELAEVNAETAQAAAEAALAAFNPALYLTKAGDLAGLASVPTARTNLGLGTAAVNNTGDFATAAQGAKADTAYQSTDLASQAEAEAGVSNTKLMTPLRAQQHFAAKAQFQTVYTSPAQTLVADGDITLTHGLGAVPKLTELILVCTTANAGFAVGDEVRVGYNSGTNTGITYGVNSTQIKIAMGTTIPVCALAGTSVNITYASWNLVVRAWV